MPERVIDERTPIRDDEELYRRIHVTHSNPVKKSAFEPRNLKSRDPDLDGISLYRAQCLSSPLDVLQKIDAQKRHASGVAKVLVSDVKNLGLSVRSSPTEIPGHVVIPELNCIDYEKNRDQLIPKMLALAEIANRPGNLVIEPHDL